MFCKATLQPTTASLLPPVHVSPRAKYILPTLLSPKDFTSIPPPLSVTAPYRPGKGTCLSSLRWYRTVGDRGHIVVVSLSSMECPAWLWDGAPVVCVYPRSEWIQEPGYDC